ncbi:MAG: 50S ribosomal protein L17 [Deltaproteobacteria bacterium]|nr:50S ribosomal protein L17 [Deltaproteobacteria bacterium]
MRHKNANVKLGRSTSHRRAMFRNMVTSLFEHEQITTTTPKAKALRPIAEKLITLAKKGDLHARRQALAFLQSKDVAHKLFSEIKSRFIDRAGGYTSIVKIGPRRGDAAELSVITLINPEEIAKAQKKEKKKKAQKKEAQATAKQTGKAPEKVETPPAPQADVQKEVSPTETMATVQSEPAADTPSQPATPDTPVVEPSSEEKKPE